MFSMPSMPNDSPWRDVSKTCKFCKLPITGPFRIVDYSAGAAAHTECITDWSFADRFPFDAELERAREVYRVLKEVQFAAWTLGRALAEAKRCWKQDPTKWGNVVRELQEKLVEQMKRVR